MHLWRLRRTKHAADLDDRTVEWISDKFCHGSRHIRQVVRGEHRDSRWARQELQKACLQIIALYDQVAIRERTADQLSRDAKADLLKREFTAMSDITTSLHVIRLGEAGAEHFRSKVADEEAREHFEQSTEGHSRSYKLFTKELERSQPAQRPRRRSSNRRAYRAPPRTSRTGRPSAPRTRNPSRRLSGGARRYKPLAYRVPGQQRNAGRNPQSRPRSRGPPRSGTRQRF